MDYSTLLFDFDYTLANASTGIFICFEDAFSQLGLPRPDREEIRRTIGMTLPDGYTHLTADLDPTHRQQFHDYFVKKADDIMVANTLALPGSVELLKHLYELGVSVGVVSTKYSYRITEFFELMGLSHCIGCVIGLEKVTAPKPAPEGIHLAMNLLGSSKNQVLYVGDTTIDALAAANAGVDFAAVLTGTTTREDFSRFPAKYIAENLGALAIELGLNLPTPMIS